MHLSMGRGVPAAPFAHPMFVGRLLAGLLIATFIATLSPTPVGAVQGPSSPEAYALSLVNDARRSMGRVPLQWDSRLGDITQDHSNYMAATGNFVHQDNTKVDSLFELYGIKWSYRAEVIMKGTPRTAMESAEEAVSVWRNSKAHWDLLSAARFNYVAFGVARAADGWYYWTGFLIEGPDRTAPTASVSGTKLGSISAGKRSVTVSWRGADVPLSVNTSGLRDFRLQRRVGSNSWVTVTDWTTRTSKSFSLTVGKTYRFRVKARDWAGNRSTWSAAVTVKP